MCRTNGALWGENAKTATWISGVLLHNNFDNLLLEIIKLRGASTNEFFDKIFIHIHMYLVFRKKNKSGRVDMECSIWNSQKEASSTPLSSYTFFMISEGGTWKKKLDQRTTDLSPNLVTPLRSVTSYGRTQGPINFYLTDKVWVLLSVDPGIAQSSKSRCSTLCMLQYYCIFKNKNQFFYFTYVHT